MDLEYWSTGNGLVDCLLGNTRWLIRAYQKLLSTPVSMCFPDLETK